MRQRTDASRNRPLTSRAHPHHVSPSRNHAKQAPSSKTDPAPPQTPARAKVNHQGKPSQTLCLLPTTNPAAKTTNHNHNNNLLSRTNHQHPPTTPTTNTPHTTPQHTHKPHKYTRSPSTVTGHPIDSTETRQPPTSRHPPPKSPPGSLIIKGWAYPPKTPPSQATQRSEHQDPQPGRRPPPIQADQQQSPQKVVLTSGGELRVGHQPSCGSTQAPEPHGDRMALTGQRVCASAYTPGPQRSSRHPRGHRNPAWGWVSLLCARRDSNSRPSVP